MRRSASLEPLETEVLSNDWGTLTKYRFRLKRLNGDWQEMSREVYDRGHGATCLLYDPDADTVLLTRQFRLPVYVTGEEGPLVEIPAGLLDGADAATRIKQELEEETGFAVTELVRDYDLFMSPGSVTEYLAFFSGHYRQSDRVSAGGGNASEGEDIEVIHLPLAEALGQIGTGAMRDGKTALALFHLALKLGRPLC